MEQFCLSFCFLDSAQETAEDNLAQNFEIALSILGEISRFCSLRCLATQQGGNDKEQ